MNKHSRERYGQWAVITGASSGIGEEFARQIAKARINVVLAARRRDSLEAVGLELKDQYGVFVRIVACDLAAREGVAELIAATTDLDVGLLINNAGTASAGAFIWHEAHALEQTIQLNVLASTELAHHFARRFAKRSRGGIVFAGSTFAYQGVPFFATYAASKAYTVALAEALHVETKSQGVDVMVLSPGPTRTAMKDMPGFDFDRMPLKWMDPPAVVRAGLKALGRRPAVVAGWVNRLMAAFGRHVATRSLLARVFGRLVRRGLDSERTQLPQARGAVGPIRIDHRLNAKPGAR